MSDSGEQTPIQAKRRLPTDQAVPPMGPAAGGGAKGVVLMIYLVAFLGMLGAAGYMLLARGAPATSPEVLVPGVGALWFLIRIVMVTRPKASQGPGA